MLENISNFHLIGLGDEKHLITGNDKYSAFYFGEDCNNIELKNLEFTPDSAAHWGYVPLLSYGEAKNIKITDCILSDAGLGIDFYNTDSIDVKYTTINNCTDAIIDIYSCNNISFSQCKFLDNMNNFDNNCLFCIGKSNLIKFHDCEISRNKITVDCLFSIFSTTNISMSYVKIKDNIANCFMNNPADTSNITFSGNSWKQ